MCSYLQCPQLSELVSFLLSELSIAFYIFHKHRVPSWLCEFNLQIVQLVQRFCVRSHIRHYWQNGGTALNPLPLFHRHGPRIKELGFVILICFFLSSAELTEENIKVLIVFERRMRRHKAFCSCAQRIIHKVNHRHLFKDFYKRVFQGEHRGCSLRLWEGIAIWSLFVRKVFMAKEFAEFRA